MSTMLDQDLASEVRDATIAVSLKFKKFGLSRALDDDCKRRAADAINAKVERIRASEDIINRNHPAVKQLHKLFNQVKAYVESVTIDYPDPTIKLLPANKLELFNANIENYRTELAVAVQALNDSREELIEQAMQDLGDGFCMAHYPDQFDSYYAIFIDFPSIEPDKRLLELNPEVYEEQKRRIKVKFDEAVENFNAAMAAQLHTILGRLQELLLPGENGERKRLRADSLNAFRSFIDDFRNVSIGANPQLELLIANANDLLSDADPAALRRSFTDQEALANDLTPLMEQLSSLTEAVPVRGITFE